MSRIYALLPQISAEAETYDAEGRVSDPLIEALTDTGFFSVLAPRVFGGAELGLRTFAEGVRRISAVSPSCGWVASFLGGAAWRLLILDEAGQKEVYGDRNYVLGAGAAAPNTGVEKVDGGYLLSGRTSWNSGASHARWFQINGVLQTDDGVDVMMFVVPRSDVEVLDDSWCILGMKGTASCDLKVERLFVPDHRAAAFTAALQGDSPGHRLHDNPLYHIPFIIFAMIEVLPVIVGMHRGATDALHERVAQRMGTLSGARAVEKAPSQIRMAQAMSRAKMADNMFDALLGEIMEYAPCSRQPETRAETKLYASMLTDFCLNSVNEMARSTGGDAFRDGAAFQRYFRDINTLARHAFLDPDTAAETYAKLLLALPVTDPLV